MAYSFLKVQASMGLTGQFLPQHRNRKEWVRFFVLWQTYFNRIHLELKNWPVMKYLKQESVSLCRTPKWFHVSCSTFQIGRVRL